MILDDLITEGKTFKMKYKEPQQYINQFGVNCIEPEEYYFDDIIAVSAWIEKCRRYIGINFKDDQGYEDFCSYGNMTPTDGTIARMLGILISFRDVAGICPKKVVAPQSTLTVNQNQTQTQTQNIEFVLERLNEDFSKEQIEKIKEIINSNLPKGSKRSKMIDLLQSFGVSVGANLLTSLFIV